MKTFRRIFWAVIIVAVLAVGTAGFAVYFGATRWRSPAQAEVVIEQGMSLRGIAAKLVEERVIGTPKLFELVGRARGLGRKLRAGTYEFPADSSMGDVLGMLARGEVKQYAFTVIEGWTATEIAAALEGQPFVEDASVPERFLELAKDPEYAASLGFGGMPSLEGFLFPDTYLVSKPLEAHDLVKRQTERFNEVWRGLADEGEPETKMSRSEVVTLASIVEKETGDASERPQIASVFFNRIKLGMPLQSDPTIIYGLPNFDGNIRKSDITNPHRYNTYVHAGLPPGPICSPGKASLEAVLHPAHTDYLYFVSRKDGTHEFSATLGEHLLAVKRFQLNGGSRARAK
jgi:UPF0755 protein